MTTLHCSVQSCLNNNCNRCILNEITISGSNTYQPDGTDCENYINRNQSITSSIGVGNSTCEINCRAKHCIFNSSFKCTADAIEVLGYTSDTIDSTLCSTFCYKTNK